MKIAVHDAMLHGLPVVTGCPFPVGDSDSPVSSAMVGDVPAQCVALCPPDTRGMQWMELSFLATSKGLVEAQLSDTGLAPGMAEQTDAGILMANEHVRILLDARSDRPSLSVETRAEGDTWLPRGKLTPEVVMDSDICQATSSGSPRSLEILRNGPIRSRARVSGRLLGSSGTPALDYRLTVELWHGIDAVRVDWMLMHLLPGVPELDVQRATLVGNWDVGSGAVRRFVQKNHGNYFHRREVVNPDPVTLIADFSCMPVHVTDSAMLLDDNTYPSYLASPTVGTMEWLALTGDSASVVATLEDFTQSRPNSLGSEGCRLDYNLIPEGHGTSWPQGRRKEQSLLLSFGPGTSDFDAESATSAMSALSHFGRAQPTPVTLRENGVFDMDTILAFEKGRNTRFSSYLDSLCVLRIPADKWNLGDTIDSHYSHGYPGVPNRHELKPGAPRMQPEWLAAGGPGLSYETPMIFLEPVWTNNEYDVIHTLAQEICRTGKNTHMRTLHWFARHNVEVDFIAHNDAPRHHRATPAHAPHHTMTGAYPSHFWTQGLLQYYLLSGDDDALEVALALGDKTIECLHHPDVTPHLKFDREAGWGLLLLTCLVEVTGESRFLAECDRLMDFFMAYDREGDKGRINLSAGDAEKCFDRQVVDCAFGYISLVEGVDRYQKLTGRADVHAWLTAFLISLKTHAWARVDDGQPGGQLMHMMAIGYERTGDRDFLDVAMVGIDALFGPFANRPTFNGETKPAATAYRSLQRILGHADRAGLLDQFEYPTMKRRRSPSSRDG